MADTALLMKELAREATEIAADLDAAVRTSQLLVLTRDSLSEVLSALATSHPGNHPKCGVCRAIRRALAVLQSPP